MEKKMLPGVNTIPPEILQILGPPPILSSENERVYYATLESFAKHIGPTDIITWFMTKDMVDSRIETARHRRNKASLIDLAKPRSGTDPLAELFAELSGTVFRPVDEHGNVQLLPKKEPRKSEQRVVKVQENDAPVDPASVASQWIPEYQKLDSLQCTAERRFASALYDLHHYMNGLRRDLREARETTIEGEFVESSKGGGQLIDGEATRRSGIALGVERSRGDSAANSSEAVGRKPSEGSKNASLGAGRRKMRGIR